MFSVLVLVLGGLGTAAGDSCATLGPCVNVKCLSGSVPNVGDPCFLTQEHGVDCSLTDREHESCCVVSHQCSCVQRRHHRDTFPSKVAPQECRTVRRATPALLVAGGVALVALGVVVSFLCWRRRARRARRVEDHEREQSEARDPESAEAKPMDPELRV